MGNKYSSVAISGYNATPPSDDGSTVDANKVKWSTHKTKIGDPLNAAIVAIDAALVTRFAEEAQIKTANYVLTASDHHKLIECTGTISISLYDASTAGAGYQISVVNVGVGVVTVDRATVGNTINGVAQNWTLNPGCGATFRVNATNNGYDVVSSYTPDFNVPTSAGGTLAYTVTFAPGIAALYTGIELVFIVNATNTGAVTLAVNGLAAKNIYKEGGAALVAGDLPAGAVAHVIYNGAEFRLNRTTASSLLSGASMTDVVHLTGAETISGAKTFSSVIVGTAATLSTHLVTKAQLDAKTYGGRIANGGTASVAYGPAGWTVSRTSTGITVITHNLNTTSFACTAVAQVSGVCASITALSVNTFTVTTFTSSTGAVIDYDYAFTMVLN